MEQTDALFLHLLLFLCTNPSIIRKTLNCLIKGLDPKSLHESFLFNLARIYSITLFIYQYPDLSNKALPLQWICITFLLELIGSVAYNPHKDFFLSQKNHRCIWGCEYLIFIISSSCLIFDLPSPRHGCWASYTGVCMVSRVISQSGVLLFPCVLHHSLLD